MDRPNAAIVFWSFRLMAGLGVLVTCATLGCGRLIYKTEGELQLVMAAKA